MQQNELPLFVSRLLQILCNCELTDNGEVIEQTLFVLFLTTSRYSFQLPGNVVNTHLIIKMNYTKLKHATHRELYLEHTECSLTIR